MCLRSLAQAWRAQASAAPLRSFLLVAAVLLVAVSDAAWDARWTGLAETGSPAVRAAQATGDDTGMLLAAPRRLVLVTLGTAGLAARRSRALRPPSAG